MHKLCYFDVKRQIEMHTVKYFKYNNSNFDYWKMSLVRNSSRKKFTISPEDLLACLDQKNSMIAVLQAEVQELRFNHQKYQRMQEQVHKIKEKYESSLRNYQMSRVSNKQRLDLTAKNCLELRIHVDHLAKEIQIKSQQLKEVKTQLQQLFDHSVRRQDEAAECQVRAEELKTTTELLKMQEERVKSQITLAKEEFERQRRENSNINKSIETIKDKCYKTQGYIRNLSREQSTRNESLTKIEDQNNYFDSQILELNSIHAIATGEVAQIEKEVQQEKFFVASKQIELKKLQKEIKETNKTFNSEKQKTKILIEQVDHKRGSLGRMENEVRQCSEEINYILTKNHEVTEVNQQLKNDLSVCEKHLENLIRLNKNIEGELTKFKEVNVITIKKLQEPTRDISNNYVSGSKMTSRKWSDCSRMTATGGFENF